MKFRTFVMHTEGAREGEGKGYRFSETALKLLQTMLSRNRKAEGKRKVYTTIIKRYIDQKSTGGIEFFPERFTQT